jgi:Flp pilus assembly protein TadD
MPQDSVTFVSTKKFFLIGGIFYLLFLLLTPLGLFNDWIPPLTHSGYYSVKTVDGGDDTGYYSYLRSIFFDGDIDFINERYYAHINRFNSTGYVFSNWQLGQAVLYLPFFVLGHFLALLYSALGYPIKADGYASPYFIATAVASATYLFAGLMIMCRVLNKIVSERVAVIATVSLWMASPLLYYTFIRQRMAHTTEFFLAALFIMVWLYYRESNNKSHHAVIGACLGLLCLVRLINANYGVLYIVDVVFLWIAGEGSLNSAKIKETGLKVLCFVAMFLVFLLPQFVAWNQLNGFIISPYLVDTLQSQAIETSTSSVMLGSKLYDLFFSEKWGLAVATPLWFAGLIGLFISGPVSKSIRFASLASIISLIVVMLSFVESDAYGNRYFIAAAVLFTIGLANLLHRCSNNKRLRYAIIVFIVVCVISQYLMIVQYKVVLPYNHSNFSIEAISGSFQVFFNHPSLLLRSTNFFRLMGFEHAEWNYVDGIYLLVFPLAQFVCVVGVLYLFRSPIQTTSVIKKILHPKNIVITGILLNLLLVGVVVVAAPDKSAQEIEKRATYKQLLSIGDSYFAKGNFESAQVSFSQAVDLMPDLWTPYFKKGIVFGSQSKLKQAEKEFRKALDIYPDHPSIMVNYGTTLLALGEVNKAEVLFRAAIRQFPKNPSTYNSLAQIFLKQKKPERARDMLLLAVRVNPKFAPGHANLAMLYAMMNQSSKAKEHLAKAVQLGLRNSLTESLHKILQNPLLKNSDKKNIRD